MAEPSAAVSRLVPAAARLRQTACAQTSVPPPGLAGSLAFATPGTTRPRSYSHRGCGHRSNPDAHPIPTAATAPDASPDRSCGASSPAPWYGTSPSPWRSAETSNPAGAAPLPARTARPAAVAYPSWLLESATPQQGANASGTPGVWPPTDRPWLQGRWSAWTASPATRPR